MTTPGWIRPIAEALDEAGWPGPVEVEADEAGHVHVRWNGRHVEAVSVEAAVLFIEADTRAKAAEAHEHSWDGNGCCACGDHELREEDARNYPRKP